MAPALLGVTAMVALLFGALLLAIPEPLLALFGLSVDLNASLFARVLGGSWLGYAVVNWFARAADASAQRAVLLADLCTALIGLAACAYVAAQGRTSALAWVWVVLFVMFAIAQLYLLTSLPRRSA
jgi:hypothetical protein